MINYKIRSNLIIIALIGRKSFIIIIIFALFERINWDFFDWRTKAPCGNRDANRC